MNEHDFLSAAMTLARNDTGAGGLVSLTGQTVPMVRFFDIGRATLPITTVYTYGSRLAQGIPEAWFIDVSFDAWVEYGSEGLEYDLLDRVEAILTTPAFKAEGLDVSADMVRRYSFTETIEGRRRAGIDMNVRLTR